MSDQGLEDVRATVRAESRTRAADRGRASALIRPALHAVRHNPGTAIAVLVLLVMLGWAVFPGLFTQLDPGYAVTEDRLLPPSVGHPFGTDHLGRDVLARVVHGTGTSLTMAACAVLLAVVVGAVIGTVAGVVGGIVDDVLMRVIDVLLALPSLLVSLVLITALGRGPLNVAIAVGLASIASFSRITRSEVLSVMASPYVESSRVLGAGRLLTLWRHVLPNSLQPVTGLIAIELGKAVLAVAALSFLGFGASAEIPEWGGIVSEGRNYIAGAWWISAFPSCVIAVLVLATNHVGESIREMGR